MLIALKQIESADKKVIAKGAEFDEKDVADAKRLVSIGAAKVKEAQEVKSDKAK